MYLSINTIPSKKEQPVTEGPTFTTYSILESVYKLFLPHFLCSLLEIKKHNQEKLEYLSILFITTHNKSTYLSSISKNRLTMTCGHLDCALQMPALIGVIM